MLFLFRSSFFAPDSVLLFSVTQKLRVLSNQIYERPTNFATDELCDGRSCVRACIVATITQFADVLAHDFTGLNLQRITRLPGDLRRPEGPGRLPGDIGPRNVVSIARGAAGAHINARTISQNACADAVFV